MQERRQEAAQNSTPEQQPRQTRAHVQKALMQQVGVKEWFGDDIDDPSSLAARFSDYCDNPENATACLSTDLNNPAEVAKLLETVRSYKKDTLH
jgi:hypothetical protein